MAPNNTIVPTAVFYETKSEVNSKAFSPTVYVPEKRKLELVWRNVILFVALHVACCYAIYLIFTSAKIATTVFDVLILHHLGGIGITAGAHRLWSHRAYKAKLPLKLLLLFLSTMTFQNSIIDWAKDHRVHHKFSDTDADPHNANRGFAFSHFGWVLSRKHPEVRKQGKKLDMSDLESDPLLAFQHKYYKILMPLIWGVFPVVVPMYFWNETFSNAFFLNQLRFACSTHAAWAINSIGHTWGNRPYDKSMNASDSLIMSILSVGEGWHNYHHVFPWDYRPSELGTTSINVTGAFINLMAKIGWAYDLKEASDDLIKKRIQRTGDGSHGVWGWGDKDQAEEEIKGAVVTYKKLKL